MIFLTDETIRSIGETLGQHFTEGQLNELGDLLTHAAAGCDYAAEDLAERADFERKHPPGSEEVEYTEGADAYTITAKHLSTLCAAIRTGEENGREQPQPTQVGAQRFYEASNGAGDTQRFFGEPSKALERATEYAQSEGGFGYVVLMERRRLNDYVGPPIWSEPVTIEEV